ncbi:MAG: class I SAM-dependent methyltransferase [Acidimicrobiales bacterium]|nr:class I SAM-dependent methyltransferase [Acidimicrobiales bacterium]
MSEVAGDSPLQSRVLESLTSVVHYQDWLTSLALPYLGEHPLELGSGNGDYARRWLDLGVPEITVSELDPSRLTLLRDRFAPEPRAHVKEIDVTKPAGQHHSCVVAFNVLEHIENDVAALGGARDLVKPGGHVVMFVPAFNFAYGRFDQQVGHFRRYTKATLRAAYEKAGLELVDLRYVNMPGLASWFVGVRLLRMQVSDSALVRAWDKTITPIARRLEKNHRPPFGQSLLAVAKV